VGSGCELGEGDFRCPVPGSGRKFTTINGLSKHVLLKHREGTFRAAGFSCHLCPRWFELERALTIHVTKEHGPGFNPFFCPFCKGFWGGRPGLLYHINMEHPITDEMFPRHCQFCPNNDPPNQIFKSAHHFRLHLYKHHLRLPAAA
jgi:hypothetical protein